MKLILALLLILLLPRGVVALTLPARIHLAITEQGEPQMYLSLGVSRYLRFYSRFTEDEQSFGEEIRLKPWTFWHREDDFGVRISKRFWKKLHLSLSYDNSQSTSFYSSFQLSSKWSVGVSAYGQDEFKGKAWIAYGIDLANFLPQPWTAEKPKETIWQNF